MSEPEPPDNESGSTITVILADDHEIMREGLRMVLGSQRDLEVVAQVGDAEAARQRTLGLKPRVLVLDLNMPGEPSLSLIPAILEASPETKIVVLTMHADPGLARRAFRLGVSGFVVKEAAGRELVDAIREAVAGGSYISPQLGARVAAQPEGPPGGLTAREIDVLRLVALGHTSPEIAERLTLSVRTVESHRSSIHRKLGTVNRAELVRFASEHGLAKS